MDFVAMQRVLYTFVIENTKASKDVLEYIKFASKETDEFWVTEFDDVYEDFRHGVPEEAPYDSIAHAIEAISQRVHDFFVGVFDLPPSKARQRVPVIRECQLTNEQLHQVYEELVKLTSQPSVTLYVRHPSMYQDEVLTYTGNDEREVFLQIFEKHAHGFQKYTGDISYCDTADELVSTFIEGYLSIFSDSDFTIHRADGDGNVLLHDILLDY